MRVFIYCISCSPPSVCHTQAVILPAEAQLKQTAPDKPEEAKKLQRRLKCARWLEKVAGILLEHATDAEAFLATFTVCKQFDSFIAENTTP